MAIQRTEIDFDPENKLKKYLLEKQGVQVNKPQTVKSSLRFLQIPFWVVKSDVWILLQPHSLRLFIFLLLKANRSGHGYVYNEQPVKYLNISENHLFDYFKQFIISPHSRIGWSIGLRVLLFCIGRCCSR